MSIANENNRVDITATATQAVFAYDFQIDDESEIAVYLTPDGNDPVEADDLLTLTTDYTISGVGDSGGGNITLTVGSFPTGAGADDVVVAIRAIPFTQPDAYNVGEDNAENYENSMDRMAMRVQRLEELLTRALHTDAAQGVLVDKFKLDNPDGVGETSIQLYDVDGTALVRVTVGADDSGGSGYKTLRIPN